MNRYELSDFVIKLTKSATSNRFMTHQAKMISLTAELVKFRTAWWGWSYLDKQKIRIVNSFTHNLPRNFEAMWKRVAADDPFIKFGRKKNDYAKNINFLTDRSVPSIDEFGTHFRIGHVLNGHRKLSESGFNFFMSLYRYPGDEPYTSDEASSFEIVLRHLEQSLSVGLHFDMTLRSAENNGWALIDAEGQIAKASGSFLDQLSAEWPVARIQENFKKAGQSLAGREDLWAGKQIVLKSRRFSKDLTLIDLHMQSGWDVLSNKERRVAELFSRGLTAREIATIENNSVNTIRNQISAVYKKLGVAGKAELARSGLSV